MKYDSNPILKLCRYHRDCAHFRDKNHTCWHEEEAETYCGLFRHFAMIEDGA